VCPSIPASCLTGCGVAHKNWQQAVIDFKMQRRRLNDRLATEHSTRLMVQLHLAAVNSTLGSSPTFSLLIELSAFY